MPVAVAPSRCRGGHFTTGRCCYATRNTQGKALFPWHSRCGERVSIVAGPGAVCSQHKAALVARHGLVASALQRGPCARAVNTRVANDLQHHGCTWRWWGQLVRAFQKQARNQTVDTSIREVAADVTRAAEVVARASAARADGNLACRDGGREEHQQAQRVTTNAHDCFKTPKQPIRLGRRGFG